MDDPLIADTSRDAHISADGLYRYTLTRTWDTGPVAAFIMLNPSTADATQDDPTIRRCTGFARTWALAGIKVVNLYAYRTTNPRELWQTDNPVGPINDVTIAATAIDQAATDAPLIAAWGAHAKPDRVRDVLNLPCMGRLTALGTTTYGHPRHPLYLPHECVPQPWQTGM